MRFIAGQIRQKSGGAEKFFGVDPGAVSRFRCARNPIPTIGIKSEVEKCSNPFILIKKFLFLINLYMI